MNKGQLLDISGAYWRSCTLHAGVALDVFTHIGRGAEDPASLAKAVGADQRALTLLCNARACWPSRGRATPWRQRPGRCCPGTRLGTSAS